MSKADGAMKSAMLMDDSCDAAIKRAAMTCDAAVDLAVEARSLNVAPRVLVRCAALSPQRVRATTMTTRPRMWPKTRTRIGRKETGRTRR